MRPALLLAAFFCLFGGLLSAADKPASGGLIGSLSPEEFARAGLAKLTSEELAALDAALSRHQAPQPSRPVVVAKPALSPSPTAKSATGLGAEQVAMVAKPADTAEQLHTRIEGTLEGFSGRAVFSMENGQIWQVRIPESVSFVHKLTNPEVVITRGAFGYKMLIVEPDRVVAVKRIQ